MAREDSTGEVAHASSLEERRVQAIVTFGEETLHAEGRRARAVR